MEKSGIKISRYPYEEPYHLNLRIEASNGRFSGNLEYYCNADDLKTLGQQLADFLGSRTDEIIYELGSEKPEDRFAFFLSLRVKAFSGYCAVSVRLSNNRRCGDLEISEFSIRAEVASLNRLGRMFIHFGRLEHLGLHWWVQDGRLFETLEEFASSDGVPAES